MWRGAVLVGIVLSVGSMVPSVQAQQGVDGAGARPPVVAAPLGIPVGAQIIDVRWSGDRMGEFTIIATLPPEFRGPPVPSLGAPLRPAP
jgi:hypothetical protein